MVTQDLFLCVTLTTLMHVLLSRLYGSKASRLHGIALCVGVLASIALAAVKYNTYFIISSHWNHYIYAVVLTLTVLVLLFTILFGRKENERAKTGGMLLCAAGSLLSATLIFYSLPGVLLYPFSFNTMGQGYLSSYYAVRMAGWLGALILLFVYSRLLSRCALYIKPYGLVPAALNTGLLTFAVYCFGRFFVPWVNRAKWLGWPVKYDGAAYGWIGDWMMFTANHSMLFIWIVAGIAAALAVILFRQGTIIKEPYDNPAQLRKLKARNRHWRRVAVGVVICLALCVIIMTVENVSDGHLHRFEYRTEKNIDVRWIVVKKPNSASFGVGLDACEVCGNAGYFERSSQVICKRCDVVMNINTIGFKGGCNPIPLAYEVKDGNLVFKLSDIIAGEKEFR